MSSRQGLSDPWAVLDVVPETAEREAGPPDSEVRVHRVDHPKHPSLEAGVRAQATVRFRPAGDPRDVVLASTSAAEGGYNAVNLYDRGILSWGIMQWTGHAGSLQRLLAFTKARLATLGQPSLWGTLFPDLDIVIVGRRPEFTHLGRPVVGAPALRTLFRGSAARGQYDLATITRWAAVFAQAGRNPLAQQLQREHARNSVDHVLSRDLRGLFGARYRRVRDYVGHDPKAAALFFGMWINNPKQSYLHLKRAIDALAGSLGGFDPSRWRASARALPGETLERVLRASTFAWWGDAAAARAGRKSRTQKILEAYAKATGARPATPMPPARPPSPADRRVALSTRPQAVASGPAVVREQCPPAYTLYLSIPLGSEVPGRPQTGIFIPSGYRPEPEVDLVLYLHGHKKSTPALTIEHYWNARLAPHFALREGLNAADRNAVLVAPTLGPASQAGRLVRPGGFDEYLDRIRMALRDHGPYAGAAAAPTIRHVILACHSGGGAPMLALARGRDRYAAHIRECWGFDSLYGEGREQLWASWARSRPDARLFIHYGSGGTATRSERLRQAALPNVSVEGSVRLAHDDVPRQHWVTRLTASPLLRTRVP